MFRWLIGSSLQFRILVLGVAVALVVFGTIRLQKMPVDVFPEFAAPVVEVQTEAIGLSAQEVEGLITHNLEELLSGVPWLKSIRSKSVTGLSSIVIGNPHNQTLAVAVQWGLIGCVLLYAMWISHLLLFRHAGFVGWMGALAVMQNIVSSLFNSHLLDFYQGWLYVIAVGIAGGTAWRLGTEAAPSPKSTMAHSAA